MMTLLQAAQILQAPCPGSDQTVFSRVMTDSRQIQPGDLFVALRGEKFDGHAFTGQAIAHGAVGAIVDRQYQLSGDEPVIVVADTIKALGQLAHAWRQQMPAKILAITGSSGKTTVKEMLATILCQTFGDSAVLATSGNFNNHIGLPLTLLSLTPAHRFAVVEMGMNHFGEIRYLTHLARPDVALVNNAQGAHLEALGSVEGVARAKAEIFEGLTAEGIAVINADDAHSSIWRTAASGIKQISFGLRPADVRAENIVLDTFGSHFTLLIGQDAMDVVLSVPGMHNINNALAAAAMAWTCGLSLLQISSALSLYAGVKGRLDKKTAWNGAVLIDDTYNANPGSIRAAIDVLAGFAAPRVLILGDIGEAGNDVAEIHRQSGVYAKEKGIETLLTLGENMCFAAQAFGGEHFVSLEALLARAREVIRENSTVLVKGSRFMRMERVVAALEAVKNKD